MRRNQRRGLAKALQKALHRMRSRASSSNATRSSKRVGRLKGRFPKARPFVRFDVTATKPARTSYGPGRSSQVQSKPWLRRRLPAAQQSGRLVGREFWETYIQLTVVERAFRVLKSELLLRPIWHHYCGRTQAHVLICVLAYALWKTLDHLAKRAGLMTLIHKPDRAGKMSPKPRPMTPEVILRELSDIRAVYP